MCGLKHIVYWSILQQILDPESDVGLIYMRVIAWVTL